MERRHMDCRNFAPVDVSKGICLRSKQTLASDAPACEAVSRLPRCGGCARYSPCDEQPGLGACAADKHEPMAYADLIAVTCKDFRWKDR